MDTNLCSTDTDFHEKWLVLSIIQLVLVHLWVHQWGNLYQSVYHGLCLLWISLFLFNTSDCELSPPPDPAVPGTDFL